MLIPHPVELPLGVPEYPSEHNFRQSEWHHVRLCEWLALYVEGGLYPTTLGTHQSAL